MGENKHLIHCQDCIYWREAEEGVVEMSICERRNTEYTGRYGGYLYHTGPIDYCSFAKEKANVQNG